MVQNTHSSCLPGSHFNPHNSAWGTNMKENMLKPCDTPKWTQHLNYLVIICKAGRQPTDQQKEMTEKFMFPCKRKCEFMPPSAIVVVQCSYAFAVDKSSSIKGIHCLDLVVSKEHALRILLNMPCNRPLVSCARCTGRITLTSPWHGRPYWKHPVARMLFEQFASNSLG